MCKIPEQRERRKNPERREELIRYMMQNHFYYDKTFSHDLREYFIRQWSTKQAIDILNSRIIDHACIAYDIIYHQTTLAKIKKSALQYPESCVKLSFRAAKSGYNIRPVVLVKLYKVPTN